MSRALITIRSEIDRKRVANWAAQAPTGTRVEFKASKRTLPQNDKLWACLTEVARQVEWHGQKLTPSDWKDIFTASLRAQRAVPGLEEGTVVYLGLHSSDLSKYEFSDLLELIHAFAAERNITLGDKTEAA